jgi:hypothetical protein
MEVWASAGGRLYIASRAEDANGLFVTADSTPVGADYSIREGGSNTNLAGTHSITVEDHCYLNVFTPTTALTAGQFIEVELTAVYGGVTKKDFGSCIVQSTATGSSVNEIIALLATKVINNNSPVSRNGQHLDIIRGAAYDGTHHGKFRWTVDTDYTDGWVMHLRVYLADSGEEPEPIMAITGAAESAESIAAQALNADTLWDDLTDAEYNKRHVFEVAMEKDDEWKVIIPNGTCTLYRGRISSSS